MRSARPALVGLLLLAATLAGCTSPSGPEPGPPPPQPPPARPPEEPAIVLASDRPAISVGAWAAITATFVNGPRWFNYTSPDTCSGIRVRVTAGDRQVELLSTKEPGRSQACGAAITPMQVAPGQRVERTVWWNGTWLDPTDARTYDPAPPGLYEVVADFAAHGPWPTGARLGITVRASSVPPPEPQPTPPPPPQPQPPPPDQRPRIQVMPQRAAFRQGETAGIVASFNNTSEQNHTYTSRDGCDDIGVWVETDEGAERLRLWPISGPYACTAALSPVDHPPGTRMDVVATWDGSRGSQGGSPFVVPGPYWVQADFDGWVGGLDASWPTEGRALVVVVPDAPPLVSHLGERTHSGATYENLFPDFEPAGPPPAECVAYVDGQTHGEAGCTVDARPRRLWGDPANRTVPWTLRAGWPPGSGIQSVVALDAAGLPVASWAGGWAPWRTFATE